MKTYNAREFIGLLRENGFAYIRTTGSHRIFCNGSATVAVPLNLNPMIARRLIKEHHLLAA